MSTKHCSQNGMCNFTYSRESETIFLFFFYFTLQNYCMLRLKKSARLILIYHGISTASNLADVMPERVFGGKEKYILKFEHFYCTLRGVICASLSISCTKNNCGSEVYVKDWIRRNGRSYRTAPNKAQKDPTSFP